MYNYTVSLGVKTKFPKVNLRLSKEDKKGGHMSNKQLPQEISRNVSKFWKDNFDD